MATQPCPALTPRVCFSNSTNNGGDTEWKQINILHPQILRVQRDTNTSSSRVLTLGVGMVSHPQWVASRQDTAHPKETRELGTRRLENPAIQTKVTLLIIDDHPSWFLSPPLYSPKLCWGRQLPKTPPRAQTQPGPWTPATYQSEEDRGAQ